MTVQMGILRSQVHISRSGDYRRGESLCTKIIQTYVKRQAENEQISVREPEINLLGKTVDEAVSELDKYLDDALLSHLNTVRVVHGKEPEHSEKEFTNS